MAYLFEDDKSILPLASAVTVTNVTINDTVPGKGQWTNITHSLQNEELYTKGYTPIGIVGYKFRDTASVSAIKINGSLYIEANTIKCQAYNDTGYVTSLGVIATVLWVKQ